MNTHRLVLTVALTGLGAGCTSMRTVQPAQVIPQQHPAFVWVYSGHGSAETVTEVLEPRLVGDTIRGTVADLGDPFVASLKDVVEVKAKEPDGVRTALLIGGALIVGGFTVYQVSHTGGGSNGVNTCTPSAVEAGDCPNTGQ